MWLAQSTFNSRTTLLWVTPLFYLVSQLVAPLRLSHTRVAKGLARSHETDEECIYIVETHGLHYRPLRAPLAIIATMLPILPVRWWINTKHISGWSCLIVRATWHTWWVRLIGGHGHQRRNPRVTVTYKHCSFAALGYLHPFLDHPYFLCGCLNEFKCNGESLVDLLVAQSSFASPTVQIFKWRHSYVAVVVVVMG